MIDNAKSSRFVNSFLDYWLDLRDILANAPDAILYPDYYLDDELTEASVFETRAFFTELIKQNLPARNLVDSEFTYVNERLAKHYKFDLDTPWESYSEETKGILLWGSKDKINFSKSFRSGSKIVRQHRFEGVIPNTERRF